MKKSPQYFFIAILTGILFYSNALVNAQSFHHQVRGMLSLAELHAEDVHQNVVNVQPNKIVDQGDFWNVLNANHVPYSVPYIKPKLVRANLKLSIDHKGDQQTQNVAHIWNAYTYRVLVSIKGYTVPGDNNIFSSFSDTLTVSYDPDTILAYQDINLHTYYGYYKIEAEVIDVYDWTAFGTQNFSPPTTGFIGNNNTSAMARNWKLEAFIEEQKYDKELYSGGWQNAMANANLNITSTAPQSGDNHLLISWNIVSTDEPSPSLYELEWTFVDDYNVTFSQNGDKVNVPAIGSPLGTSLLWYDFKKNSTRVITSKPEYKIPLIYKQGYLVFRARLIRPDETNYRHNIYSNWTLPADAGTISTLTPNSSKYYYYIATGNVHLADNYNWNYQATYAEEGKTKSIVTYYDNLLKPRQTITKLSSLPGQQIVTETYYNHEGKPSLQVLPIPVAQNALKFIDNFAQPSGSTSGIYKATDIDPKNASPLAALDNTSPADVYYSSSNQFQSVHDIYKAIPDAEGYPMVHTKFAPEDGRVISQGGAGEELQLGSGHETRNYYLPATQFELDKYFGYDIGKSPFYEKTITSDPNKQLSFSIANNKGQTVMSGLMGYPSNPASSPLLMPDNVTLPSDANFPQVDILYGHNYIWSGNSRRYSIPYFMEKSGTANFEHSILLNSFNACSGKYLNVPLTYNIKYLDDYGIPQTIKSQTIGTVVAGSTPVNHSASSTSLTANTVIGKSTIEYEVTYNPNDVTTAVNQLFDVTTPPCVTSKQTILNQRIAGLKFDCMDKDEDVEDHCLQLKEMLKDELYPNGKYGKYTLNANGEITGTVGLFAPATTLTQYVYRYKEYIALVANQLTVATLNGLNVSDLLAMPVEKFIENFDESYAEAIIGFHPEYCKYQKTKIDCSGLEFENKLKEVQWYDIAKVLGIYSASSSTPLSDLAASDPIHSNSASDKLSTNKLTKISVFYPTVGANGTWVDERIDHVAYVKLFCSGGMECRSMVMSWTEAQIRDEVAAIPEAQKEKRDEFVQEIISLYLANRKDRVERLRVELNNTVTCSQYSGAMPENTAIQPYVIDFLYANSTDNLPKYSNNDDYFDETDIFTNNGHTTTEGSIKSKLRGNTANDINGFAQYADEIIKKLWNCRDINGAYNPNNNLRDALIAHMQNAGEDGAEWKGNIKPETLKAILLDYDYTLDDLCNPYLVDYQHNPTDMMRDYGCRSEDFYEGVADFLFKWCGDANRTSNTPVIRNELVNSGVNSGALSSGTTIGGTSGFFDSNNPFEVELVTTLTGSWNSAAQIHIKAVNGGPNGYNSITLYFFEHNSGGNYPLSKAVSINFDFGDISMWDGAYGSPSYIFIDSMIYYYSVSSFLGTTTYHNDLYFYEDGQFNVTNRVTCNNKPSFRDDVLYINAKINVFWEIYTPHTLFGTIRGLKSPGQYDQDQNQCITCVELKDAFDKQSTSLASFKEDVMDEYGITGIGHPYFETALASYLNFNFIKGHTAKEYLDFMVSCDLAGEYSLSQLYGYLHASSTDTNELNDIYNAIKNYSSGKYPNFNHLYYFKTTGSTITEGNLYVDFNDFEKKDLRAIKTAIANSGTTATVTYNTMEKTLRSEPLTFADLFVHYIDGAGNGPADPCTGGPAASNENWVPKMGAFLDCSTGTNPIDITSEVVTVRHGNLLTPYQHFHLEFKNTPTVDQISEYTYIYNNEVLPDDSRSFLSWGQYMTTGTIENLEDEDKIDYLKYTYSKIPPDNYDEKTELIRDLQPDRLKANINGTGIYTANYNGYYYVNYFDKWKGINSGDLFIRHDNPKCSTCVTGLDYIEDRVNDIKGAINSSQKYFHDALPPVTNGNIVTEMKFLPNNVVWYKTTQNGAPKNIWLKFPDYLPYAGFDITSFQLDLTTLDITGSTSKSGNFTVKAFKGLNNNIPATPDFPYITIYGRVDFSLPEYKLYRNVLLCSDIAAEDNDDFFLCYEDKIKAAEEAAEIEYLSNLQAMKTETRAKFIKHIEDNIQNELNMKSPQASYIVTLYGYDRAGNLAYTVPPQGVKPIWDENTTASVIDDKLDVMKNYRQPSTSQGVTGTNLAKIVPLHTKETKYAYNAANELLVQSTPDGGETNFYYDKTGKLICSQNAQQELDNTCSYTLYDRQNRIIETGLINTTGPFAPVFSTLTNGYYPNPHTYLAAVVGSPRSEVIHTFYDEPLITLESRTGMSPQDFLRNRPATIARYDKLHGGADSNYAIAIHYSYDVSGNVKTLTYDMPVLTDIKQRYKRIDYDYDLYSGKVTLVSYNRSFADQFYQRYAYDADNRIEKVETSADGLLWDIDAEYIYYPHGPLASVSLGDLAVQKLDFVYTLQGWLKSINGDAPNPDKDWGGDKSTIGNSAHQADLLRSTLYYFNNDYKAVNDDDYSGSQGPISTMPDIATSASLYNGNIAAAVTIPGYFPSLYTNYTYDQLNRIKASSYLVPDYSQTNPANVLRAFSASPWSGTLLTGQSGFSADKVYGAEYTYDWDGNLATLKRYGMYAPNGKYDYTSGKAYLMDDLQYQYASVGNVNINRLRNYTDDAQHSANSSFTNDLQNYQSNTTNLAATRLTYDAIGNLVSDASNGLSSISWNMYGKVARVTKADGSYTAYNYDPLNNRFSKSIVTSDGKGWQNEYYIRDAGGNLLTVFRQRKKTKLVKVYPDILTDYVNIGNDVLAGDINVAMGNHGAFAQALMINLIDYDPTVANNLADKDVSYYMAASEPLKNALIKAPDDFVDDLLANNISIIKNPLYSAYDEQFFTPLFTDTADSTRLVLIGLLVDSTDTTTMAQIVDSLYPALGLPDDNRQDFAEVLDFAMTEKSPVDIHGILAHFITGTKLEDAVDRLMANTHFMEGAFPWEPYNNTKAYLHDMVMEKGSLPALQTYFDNRADGQELLATIAPLEDKLLLVYLDSPQAFLETVLDIPDMGREIVGEAFAALPDVTPEGLVGMLHDAAVSTSSASATDYATTSYTQVTEVNKTWLAEQVLYGSSRLGVKTYWPNQYAFEYDLGKTKAENDTLLKYSPFTYRNAWYFKDYNNLVKANETSPWGNENSNNISARRVLGLKHYELANHLGNVMGVVTDKLTEEKEDPQQSLPTPAIKRASLFAAYDYYPFGMLMPERYVQDETQQCTPVTRSMMVKKRVAIWDLPISNSGAELFDGGIGTTIGYVGASQEIEVTADAMSTPDAACTLPDGSPTAGKKYAITIQAGMSGGGPPAQVEIIQDDGNGDQVLAQSTISLQEAVTMDLTSVGTADPRIRVTSGDVGATIRIQLVTYKEIDEVVEDVVVMECNDDEFDDDYRFGFNGQQKENNLKGIGNHNTAMFWEYDTRLGRRWNIDPKWNEWESTYACFGGNPILYSDVNGDSWWDQVMGSAIGAATNLIPGGAFTNWRDSYTPDDPVDYNNALRSSDAAAIALGVYSITTGGGMMAAGGTATATVVGAEVGIPVAAAGAVVTTFGAGTVVNGTANAVQGYNRGNKGGAQVEKQSAEKIENRQANPETGKIYKVPGEKTQSGDPYIGRTQQSSPAKRGTADGRDRTDAEILDTYDPLRNGHGAYKEQKAIDKEGGIQKLDNKRNEVSPKRMQKLKKDYGNE